MLSWAVSVEGIIDFLSIAPWWVEKTVGQDMPTTTPLRVLRVFRILNHEASRRAVKTLARECRHSK